MDISTTPAVPTENRRSKSQRILLVGFIVVAVALTIVMSALIGFWAILLVPVAVFALALGFNVIVALWKNR
jgi:hypothetical protein